jgi:hypothetical protein
MRQGARIDGVGGTARALVLLACVSCSAEKPEAAKAEPWQKVFEGLSQALLSVWGTSESDVWTVGSDVDDGTGPLVLRFDGDQWTRLMTGSVGDLWWAFGFEGGPVFMGGVGGRVLRYQDGAFETQLTPGTSTVYGIWGASADDLWAVGGDGAAGGFAWRFDGSTWSDFALPAGLRDSASLFKVWGRSKDDVWLVGTAGTLLHYDGVELAVEESGTTRDLFTVNGNAERVDAVGGSGDGVIVENSGSGWQEVTPAATPVLQLAGVCLDHDAGYAVGDYGSVLTLADAGWTKVELGVEVVQSFHATWIDPQAGVWAVGGEVSTLPLSDGVMVHKGANVPGGTFQ